MLNNKLFKEYFKHTKIQNCIGCYYCNSLGWIAWKSKTNSSINKILNLIKQPTIILYSKCTKCQTKSL